MEYLMPMTDFVLEEAEKTQFKDDCEFAYSVRKYANFVKQPLKKGMFVPCDDNDNVLEEPNKSTHTDKECEQYKQAKEKVIFEGFRVVENNSKSHPKTIQLQNIFTPFWFLTETNSWHIAKNLKTIEDLIPCQLKLTKNFKP